MQHYLAVFFSVPVCCLSFLIIYLSILLSMSNFRMAAICSHSEYCPCSHMMVALGWFLVQSLMVSSGYMYFFKDSFLFSSLLVRHLSYIINCLPLWPLLQINACLTNSSRCQNDGLCSFSVSVELVNIESCVTYLRSVHIVLTFYELGFSIAL